MLRITVIAAGLAALGLCGCSAPLKPYDYPAWGFTVSFPAAPKVTETQASGADPHSLLVEQDNGLCDLVVFAVEAPSAAPDSIDRFTDSAAPVIANAIGGEVGMSTYVATVQLTNQATGREVQIDKGGRAVSSVRFYQVGQRFYEMGANCKLGPKDPAGIAFLDSFKVAGPPPASNATS